jgi:hypothetical protein
VLDRFRNRALGPGDKAVVLAVSLVLLAGLVFAVVGLLPEKCGSDFEPAGNECVGVTAGVLTGDRQLKGLIDAVAAQNAKVEKDWKDPENGKNPVPYVRIALMMPFSSDETSVMSREQIARALAGAYTAQLQANAQAGPHYQLLLAHDGKNLDHWRPVVDQLAEMADDKASPSPLVGVFGMPSSIPDTLHAANVLSAHRIPAIGAVLTSTTMKSEYLFKTSPSNELFAQALRKYLDKKPGSKTGFLVSDMREKDSYAVNLREVFLKQFGDEYGLRQRRGSYLGLTGDDEGVPQRFSDVARNICLTKAGTVFFAGRDHDLPGLVDRLANEPPCDHKKPIRILKVGIGLDPVTTSPEVTANLSKAKATLVDAASVDTRSWKGNKHLASGPGNFLGRFEKVQKEQGKQQAWGDKPLDDGYAAMYYDAFTVFSQATDQAYENNKSGDKGNKDNKGNSESTADPFLPNHDDVYRTIVNVNIRATPSGRPVCGNCIQGASGTFGFDQSPDIQGWAVCKPVPIIEYPEPPATGANTPVKTYRTHEDTFGGNCPP